MKKIISLFVSMLLIFSMTCSVALAEVSAVADEIVLVDTENAQGMLLGTWDTTTLGSLKIDGVTVNPYIKLSTYKNEEITSDAAGNSDVIKVKNAGSANKYIRFNIGNSDQTSGVHEMSFDLKSELALATFCLSLNGNNGDGWITEKSNFITADTLYRVTLKFDLDNKKYSWAIATETEAGSGVFDNITNVKNNATLPNDYIPFKQARVYYRGSVSGNVYLENFKYTYKPGLYAEANVSGSDVSGTAIFCNEEAEPTDYIAYLASYDAEGELISIVAEEIDANAGAKYKVELTDTQEAASAKMFVWKGLEPVAYAASN